MKSDGVVILTPEDIRALLSLDECIEAVEQAFRLYGEGKAIPPAVASVDAKNGAFHVKAGMLSLGKDYFAAKINGNFPTNGERFRLPTIQGVIVLCDAQNGTALALMDSRHVTSLRTAAATAVAAKYLARKDSRVLTVCGCGNQGRFHLQALSRVCEFDVVFTYDKSMEHASRLAQEFSANPGWRITPAHDLEAACRQSDVCVTCTTSQEPLLGTRSVKPGAFLAAVGADNPRKQELAPELMANSKIVCDMIEQCATMGDLHHALDAGAVARADVHAELGEIVAGKKRGRETEEEIIVFDSTGIALQDVAAAAIVYERAERKGVGFRLSLAA